jgi:peptidoglycan-associated lipoprotein
MHMKKSIRQVCFWSFCALLATGCQQKSGNIWDDNQTVGDKYKYSDQNSSSLWETNSNKGSGISGPVEEEFIPLDEQDLKTQFTDRSVPQPSRDLGEGGIPSADQFGNPTGTLASIFSPVFFNTDEHSVKGKEYLESIRRMASYMKAHPSTYVIVEGYCDQRGPEAYNLSLGTKRANFVRSLLVKEGVNPDQLHTISYGKEKPFDPSQNPDAWAKNRRAHFRVHDKK